MAAHRTLYPRLNQFLRNSNIGTGIAAVTAAITGAGQLFAALRLQICNPMLYGETPQRSRHCLCRRLSPGFLALSLLASSLPGLFWAQTVSAQNTPELSELDLTVSDRSASQQFVAGNIGFMVFVSARDSNDEQIAVDGLRITVENISNIAPLQDGDGAITFPVTFNGTVGMATVDVALLRQGQNGQLRLGVAGLPAQHSVSIRADTITVVALEEHIAGLNFRIGTTGPSTDLIRFAQTNWFIDTMNRRIFSRSDRAADTDTSFGRDPSRFIPQGTMNVQLQLINSMTGTERFITPVDSIVTNLTKHLIPGPGLAVDFNGNLFDENLPSLPSLGSSVSIFLDPGSSIGFTFTDYHIAIGAMNLDPRPDFSAWFTAPDSTAPRMATLTLSVSGLPPSVANHIATSQEWTLIDQALSTVTLSVVGEIAPQAAPGAPVAVTLEVALHGTFGINYYKYLNLNLAVSATAGAQLSASRITLNFGNIDPLDLSSVPENSLRTTLMVTPSVFDSMLMITVEREGLDEAVVLAPAAGLELPIRAAPDLARAELTPLDTTQQRLVNPELPIEIDFRVRGFDLAGNPFDATLMPTAIASVAGTDLSISPGSLRLGSDGEGMFTVTVTPPPGYFAPLVVTVGLAGLPTGAELTTVAVTIAPEIDSPTVILVAREQIGQSRPTAELVFDVTVNIWDVNGMRISREGLQLTATAGANTTVPQQTWPVTFATGDDGQFSGTAQVRAGLVGVNRDGSVVLGIADTEGLVLLSTRTVTLVAARFTAFVGFYIDGGNVFPRAPIGNHYIFENNSVDVAQSEPLIIVKRDNFAVFSRNQHNGPPYREFDLDIRAYDAAGDAITLSSAPRDDIRLVLTPGEGISSANLLLSDFSVGPRGLNVPIYYHRSHRRFGGQTADPVTFLRFVATLNPGVVMATMTLSVTGLPDGLVPLDREFVLIDQQLDRVSLSVDGEAEALTQSTPGAPVEVRLRLDVHDTLGDVYRKNLTLNLLVVNSVLDAQLSSIPAVRFSDDSPRYATLSVTPPAGVDVPLTVLVDRPSSGLAAAVELQPATGLQFTVRAALELSRVELTAVEGVQYPLAAPQQPREISFRVRAFDQNDNLTNAIVIPTATASVSGTTIDISPQPLTLGADGEAVFTATVVPPPGYFAALVVTVSLDGLPASLQSPEVAVTIAPEIDSPTVILAVSERVQQSRPTEELVFDVTVNIWDVNGMRISREGLQLAVTAGANTTVPQPTWPVTFAAGDDGQFSGTAQIRAGLIVPGQNGSLVIDIAGADGVVLLSSRTVTLAAAPFTAFVGIDLDLGTSIPAGTIENHYVFENNAVDVSQSQPLIIVKRDNLEAFSADRFSGNSNIRTFTLHIQAYDAAGQTITLGTEPQGRLTLTTGEGIATAGLSSNDASDPALGQNTDIAYQRSSGRFTALDSSFAFAVDLAPGVVTATMTLSVTGLPPDLVPLDREFVFIDQQLSTVTLSVDGEVPPQNTPGGTVEVRLQVDVDDTLGNPYRKTFALNLRATSTVDDVEIEPLPAVNFSDNSPRYLTLRVRPTGTADVPLTLLVDRMSSGLAAEVELLPATGLQFTVGAFRPLSRVELTAVEDTLQYPLAAPQQPQEISFRVRAFDQNDNLTNATVIPTATASVAGTTIDIRPQPLILGTDGEAVFTATVVPPPGYFATLTVTVSLDGLPAVLQSPSVEITIAPEIDSPTVILAVSERVQQSRPTEELVFDVTVNIWDVNGMRISREGLQLAVTAGANSTVVQPTWPVTFAAGDDGQFSGNATIHAGLTGFNRDGSLVIDIAGADGVVLLSSRTVTLAAAPFTAFVGIDLNLGTSIPAGTIENHYIFENNTVDVSQSQPLTIVKRDNLEAFSADRFSGNSNVRTFTLHIQAYDAAGQTITLGTEPQGRLVLTTGEGIATAGLFSNDASDPALGQNTDIAYQRSSGRFTALDSSFAFAVDLAPGVVTATMTLAVTGLPNDLLPLNREFVFIDQQLSTVTLSVDGGVPAQGLPGETVEIQLLLDTHGTLGNPYRKNLALQLALTTSTVDVEIEPVPVVNFSNDNPRMVTLRVRPTGLEDVDLTVMLDRAASSLSAGVALLPAGGLSLTVRASTASRLTRTELSALNGTAQLSRIDRRIPVEIDFRVRAFDQNDAAFDVTVIPTATTSAAGTAVTVSQTSLMLGEDGEDTFTVTVLPPPGYFAPFTVSVSLDGLPSALQPAAVEVSISPEINTPTVILAVSERVAQNRAGEELVFDVAVNIRDRDGMRIAHANLLLAVTAGANTTVPQQTWPVSFSQGTDGQFSGSATIRASLTELNRDGSLVLGIAETAGLVLLSSRTVTLAAAAFTGFVGIDLNLGTSIPAGAIEDHYVIENNAVTLPQSEPLTLFKRDNLEAFSASRLSGNSNPNLSPREFALRIQAYDATGQALALTSMPQGNISLAMTAGAGLSGALYTVAEPSRSLGQNSSLSYSTDSGFINSDLNVPLSFAVDLADGVVSATMTLSISGLPNDLLPLSREFVFIDQQLSVVTLSVDGEVPTQRTPGDTVEVQLRAETQGSLGNPYRKNLALNLVTTTTDSAELEPVPVVNFSNDNPRPVTLRVRPTSLEDVELIVMLDRSSGDLPDGVALVPAGGLPLTVRAARQLTSAQLRPVLGTTIARQIDAEVAVRIGFVVSGFDQDGMLIEGQLIATATASVAEAELMIDRASLTLTAGTARFDLSVVPPSQEPFTVTVRVTGLPAGQSQPSVEIIVIPTASRLEQLDLNEDNVVDLNELLLIQRWLETGRPDLTVGGATGATGNENLAIETVDAAGFSNLTSLYSDDRMDVNNSGSTDEIDIRILLRYRAGLRGSALGANVSEEQIRLLLGLPLR